MCGTLYGIPKYLAEKAQLWRLTKVFFRREKNHVGRMVRQQWVFGGYEHATKSGFLVAVPKRDAATLPIRYIRPGTTTVSDCWRAYDRLGNAGYNHLRVNHRYNFVNPITGATTNHVERMWKEAKRRNMHECGTHNHMINSYLAELNMTKHS